MNREQAKELLPIIEAYSNGEEIEFREIGCGNKDWRVLCDDWNLRSGTAIHEYRIKPKAREWWLCWNNDDEPTVYDYESVGWEHAVHAREILD